MLKVMLVDDEPNVRQGVKMMIPWDELDLEVIAEGEDGDDGLNKILTLSPDIVIADVKMPGMTGIQMLTEAFRRGYRGKAVILSGYSDFTYAKEAISLGVKQFILKPVDEDELIASLKTIHDEILSENESRIKVEQGSVYINEQTIKDLLLGSKPVSEIDVSMYSKCRSFMVALINSVSESNSEGRIVLMDMIRKQLADEPDVDVITINLNGMLAALFKNRSPIAVRDYLNKLSVSYHNRIFITIGCSVNNVSEIAHSYSTANELYGKRFLFLHCGVISSDDISGNIAAGTTEQLESFSKQIFTFMEINDLSKLSSCLSSFQDTLCKNMYTPERIKVICITTVMEIKASIAKSVGDKKAEQFRDEDIIAQIGSMNSLFDIIELMKNEFANASITYFGRTTKSTMERVVQYIKANYSQELRLEMLANIFGYNSAYLGKVFHQYTGENFNNYLDGIRITEAKRLLSMDEHKVYEVAEMVGYTNINYFHNKFKKYVGISPLNYKKACLGEAAVDDDRDDE